MNPFSFEIASDASEYNICEFINGQDDCAKGIEHKPGMSVSYNAGYSAQYQLEQIMGEQYGR